MPESEQNQETSYTVTISDGFGNTAEVEVTAGTPSEAVQTAQDNAPAGHQVTEVAWGQ